MPIETSGTQFGRQKMSGRRKAAILLVALGAEIAAKVYQHLTDREIELITVEVATLGNVPKEATAEVIEEFYHTVMAKEYISTGGITMARDILEKALGPNRAIEIIERLQGALQVSPFDFARRIDPKHLLTFIQNEHPQTIALVLAYLDPEQAAPIIGALPADLQADVSMRIALMDQTSPEIINEVERVLERKISNVLSQEFSIVGGVETLAELLNRVDRSTERSILDSLEDENMELAQEVKKLMFVFEDLVLLDNRAMQQVLKEVDAKELAIALRGASEAVREMVFSNMSSRAAEIIKEDMEYMGPIRVKQVEESQQRIVAIVRRLEEAGEIVISRGGEEEVLV